MAATQINAQNHRTRVVETRQGAVSFSGDGFVGAWLIPLSIQYKREYSFTRRE